MANGILAQYGLNLDEETILREQKQKQQAQALGLVQGTQPYASDQSAANIGALLGARIARPAGMTEDQQRRVVVAEQTEKRMKEWLSENKTANFRERAKQYKSFLAENAFQNGLPDVGAQVSAELDAEEQLQARRDLELEGLGIDTEKLRAGRPFIGQMAADEAAMSAERVNEAKTGRSKTLYLKGSDLPRSGYIDPKDLTAYIEGEAYPLGTYSRVAYDADRKAAGGRGGRSSDGIGVYERSKIREAYRAQNGLIRSANGMYDMVDEMAAKGSVEELGRAGGILNWANRFADNSTAIGRALADAAGVPFGGGKLEVVNEDGKIEQMDMSTAQGKAAVTRRYSNAIDQYIQDSGIAKRGEGAAKLRAKFIELAHAYLKVEEPGGRYTEADMERAMEVVGGSLTQPDTLIDFWNRKLANGMEGLDDIKLQYDPDVWSGIITPEGEQRVVEEYGRWQSRAEVPFGRASDTSGRAAPAAGVVTTGDGWTEIAPGVRIRKKSGQ